MFAAVVVVLAAAPADPPKLSEAALKELKKLEGRWTFEKIAAKGTEREKPLVEGEVIVLEIKDRRLTAAGREEYEIVALDPAADPKVFDLKTVPGDPKREGVVVEGIYKLDGDTLVLALHLGRDKNRPSGFDPSKDAATMVWTLKREKK
jgi:uncharacterized protein (TIGR03067 family)